jgi:hypothetical protein
MFHEIDHFLYGEVGDKPNGNGNPGPVENEFINPIRQQLGLPLRNQYVGTINPLDHSQRRLDFKDSDGKIKSVIWKNEQVGGQTEK